MNIEAIELFFNKIGIASTEVISKYTEWHFWSALGWTLFGIITIIFTLKFFHLKYSEDWGYEKNINLICKTLICAIGMLFILANTPDLINPEAVATHRLILDIRGSS